MMLCSGTMNVCVLQLLVVFLHCSHASAVIAYISNIFVVLSFSWKLEV